MDIALERQEREHEDILRFASHGTGVDEPLFHLKTLHGLGTLFDVVEPERLIVIVVYTSSCGICSRVNKAVEAVKKEYHNSKGVLFCRHDAYTEYDTKSDISQLYRITSVPSILFFLDGALVRRSNPIKDVREGFGRRNSEDIARELQVVEGTLSSMVAHMMIRH